MQYKKTDYNDIEAIKAFFAEFGENLTLPDRFDGVGISCHINGTIVGFVALEFFDSIAIGSSLLGSSLLVHPGFRSMGVGHHLVQMASQDARLQNAEAIVLWTKKCEFYFRAQGMVRCEPALLDYIPNTWQQKVSQKDHGCWLSMDLKSSAVAA